MQRYVFDSLRHHLPPFDEDPTLPILLGRMTACVRNAWDGVSSFLCNDAPEGFRPEGMNHEANITTRDVSSYAWRTAKESRYVHEPSDSPKLIVLVFSCASSHQKQRLRFATIVHCGLKIIYENLVISASANSQICGIAEHSQRLL